MDRNLRGNHRFRLNEDSASNGDGKLHVFVKLTDSCMRTIETYMKQNKKEILSKIKFHSTEGEITIPVNANENRSYSFQISLEDKTPEVFQCIKQINRDQLESCGQIEQRIVIQAQEDVYSMTKEKVTEFQKHEELTKKQTKEIGESSKSILEKKTNKSSNQRTSLSTMNKSKARIGINQEERLSPSTNTPSSSSSSSSAERPLRERLVHLLAARTYKKPDLIARLKSDGGIRDDEKEQLDSILSSISSQSKNAELILIKTLLTSGEVNYDWPFYPKVEANAVRKKIKELQANTSRATVTKLSQESISSVPSNSNRTSFPTSNIPSKSHNSNAILTVSSTKMPSASATEERNSLETEEISNPLSDERMQQLSDMLDKLSNVISSNEKSTDSLANDIDTIDDDEDLDEAEKEYQRLVPEYNQLIDYLEKVSERFTVLQQQFSEDQSNEKATAIVEEFFKCENNEGFLLKRQRVLYLHHKLTHLHKLLQRNSPSNSLHFDDNDDDDD